MKRELDEVVRRVLEVVPAEEVELRRELERAAYDALYKPPEGQPECWARGGRAFYDRFGETRPADGWGKKAVDIWLGRDA